MHPIEWLSGVGDHSIVLVVHTVPNNDSKQNRRWVEQVPHIFIIYKQRLTKINTCIFT